MGLALLPAALGLFYDSALVVAAVPYKSSGFFPIAFPLAFARFASH